MLADFNPDLLVNLERHRLALLPREDKENVQTAPVAGDETGNETQVATAQQGESEGLASTRFCPNARISETDGAARADTTPNQQEQQQQLEKLEEHINDEAMVWSDKLRTYLKSIQALFELEEETAATLLS